MAISEGRRVQPVTWCRARLLKMIMSDPTIYVPDVDAELDKMMELVRTIANDYPEPEADVYYAVISAIDIVMYEGIRLADVYEKRVRDLTRMILQDTDVE